MLTNAFFKTRTDGKELTNSSMVGRSSETEFTVSLWGFPSGLTQAYGQGIYTLNGSFYNTNNPGGVFRIFIFPGGGVKVYTGAGGVGGQLILSNADSPIQTDTWFHLMVVLENNTLSIFVNGDDKTSLATVTGTISTMPSLLTGAYKNFMLGYFNDTTYSWQGSMVDLATWNTALTQAQVSQVYNNGKPGDLTSLSPKNWWKLTDGSLVDSGSEADNAVVVSTLPTVVATDVNVNSSTGISSGMTTANLVTSDLTRSIPYSSYSMEFDGTADYIDMGAGFQYSDLTVSMWINPTTIAQYERIIQLGRNSGGALIGFGLAWDASSIITGWWSDGSETVTTSNSILSTATWYHLVMTRDSGGIKIYINGIDDTLAGGSTGWGDTNDNLELGRKAGGGQYFNGAISNLAIFNSSLTQDQILTIYNGGVPNSISSLSPVSWWSLAGDSYFNGNDWICPDLGSGGNNGTSSGMGGTELVGDGPGSTANGIATSMNIPGDLKGDAPNSTSNAFSVNMGETDRTTGISTVSITLPGTGYIASDFVSTTGGSGSGCVVSIDAVTGGGGVANISIYQGGSGYVVGDVLTISGGGGNATITVSSLSIPG